MNDHDDAQIDAALEALAHPEPPADHVAQVLARTGGRDASPPWRAEALGEGGSRPATQANATGYGLRAAGYLRPRWALPIAATAMAAIGLTWQLSRGMEQRLDAVMAGWDSRPYLIDGSQWGAPQEIDRPVLPPQAYWGMDAFTEFERLRPGARIRSGTQDHRNAGSQGRSTGSQGRRGEGAETAAWATETARSEGGPQQPSLPPIELESIVPAPLVVAPIDMAPLAPLEDIAIADIPLAPIAIDALIEEERP